jgi:hypothetical protein
MKPQQLSFDELGMHFQPDMFVLSKELMGLSESQKNIIFLLDSAYSPTNRRY